MFASRVAKLRLLALRLALRSDLSAFLRLSKTCKRFFSVSFRVDLKYVFNACKFYLDLIFSLFIIHNYLYDIRIFTCLFYDVWQTIPK